MDRRTFIESELEASSQSRVGEKLTELTIRKVGPRWGQGGGGGVGGEGRGARTAATRYMEGTSAARSGSAEVQAAQELPQGPTGIGTFSAPPLGAPPQPS